jgi:hypothetical protein
MRLELGARGRVFRAWEAVERGSRTQAIMVWEGQRRKRREKMPWPMPGVGWEGLEGDLKGREWMGSRGLTAVDARDEDGFLGGHLGSGRWLSCLLLWLGRRWKILKGDNIGSNSVRDELGIWEDNIILNSPMEQLYRQRDAFIPINPETAIEFDEEFNFHC